MAKPLYSVKFTSNFSFRKLSQNLNAVIDDSNLSISAAIAKNTKKNILSGVAPALEESTLIQRRTGKTSWKADGHRPAETPSETRPLYYSQRLFKSMMELSKALMALFHRENLLQKFKIIKKTLIKLKTLL